MRIYVASSWRNTYQPEVVRLLRLDGHDVYDFKDSEGFHWSEVDGNWKEWVSDIPSYLSGLSHECAERGFTRDMSHLVNADACVYVMPCGVSASLEAGWAKGAGKPMLVYVPALREPDLMVKMADLVTDDFAIIRERLRSGCRWCLTGHEKVASAVVPGGFVHLFTKHGRVRCDAACRI